MSGLELSPQLLVQDKPIFLLRQSNLHSSFGITTAPMGDAQQPIAQEDLTLTWEHQINR